MFHGSFRVKMAWSCLLFAEIKDFIRMEKIMYRNYIFDLYGTLVDIHTNEQKRYLWEKITQFYGLYGARYTVPEFRRCYKQFCKEAEAKLTDEYPELSIEFVFQRLFQEKGIKADIELAIHAGQMFRVISTQYVKLYDGVIDLLESLHKHRKKVYLLSNAQSIFTKYEMHLLDITKYFDGIVISSDVGCRKPSGNFYQYILERYHLKKEESIMIGNDPVTDILGSYEAGLDSLYIHSNISPKVEIELHSKYTVMDGDFRKIKQYLLRE